MRDADVVVIGGGAAGLSLARRLTGPRTRSRRPLTVALVDAPPGELRAAPRTWCFWEAPGGEYDAVVRAHWGRLRITGRDGRTVVGNPGPLRYKMIRSPDFERWAGAELDRAGCLRHEAVVESVRDVPGGAEVRGHDARGASVRLLARWVFDSRPPGRPGPARTTLLQHFRGWFVRTARPAFDPGVADLMDFRTPQPRHGLAFGYVLPLGRHEALVEYTEFSGAVLDDDAYDRALGHYAAEVLGLGDLEVTAVEQGVIAMTDARFPRRTGRSVFPVGVAGGATRPATGYSFAATQRHTRAIAAALARGRTPLVPAPHGARSLAMDAVLLRALDTGRVDGADLFTGLFEKVPAQRLLRFLDGRTTALEDVAVGLRTPVRPMLRTALELPFLPRRPAGPRPVPARRPAGP
ncbi:lycopene cyclase family protein [Streptomyces chromofuscus]|uniref:Lycopene cyclase n=1 Tax=Streptomyces chromofuscus TaxID=42881 RepID=A0A7M2TFG6_STRCW|nr:lycopene cyclase family protein [Streptomyces chromofuscus]QOV46488.1 lycopene cyclase [Streptomyces chromofuscus]GGS93890.1 lycopene cyclase [Streptomyces chromofuscus]